MGTCLLEVGREGWGVKKGQEYELEDWFSRGWCHVVDVRL